jgi:hypothetical protein
MLQHCQAIVLVRDSTGQCTQQVGTLCATAQACGCDVVLCSKQAGRDTGASAATSSIIDDARPLASYIQVQSCLVVQPTDHDGVCSSPAGQCTQPEPRVSILGQHLGMPDRALSCVHPDTLTALAAALSQLNVQASGARRGHIVCSLAHPAVLTVRLCMPPGAEQPAEPTYEVLQQAAGGNLPVPTIDQLDVLACHVAATNCCAQALSLPPLSASVSGKVAAAVSGNRQSKLVSVTLGSNSFPMVQSLQNTACGSVQHRSRGGQQTGSTCYRVSVKALTDADLAFIAATLTSQAAHDLIEHVELYGLVKGGMESLTALA